MAVSLKTYTQMQIDWGGRLTLAWPGTAAAGDLAVLFCQDGRRRPADTDGWRAVYGSSNCTAWSKLITAADLASPLHVRAELAGLLICANASGLGGHRSSPGIRVRSAGSGVLFFGEQDVPATTITPAAGQVGTPVLSPGWGVNQRWYLDAPSSGWRGLSGTDDDAYYQAWEILPIVGPREPTLVSPGASTTLDSSLPVTFSWLHNSTSGQVQAKAQVRVRLWTSGGTGTWYYLNGSGGWSTTATELATSSTTATLNAGTLTANSLYEWTARTQDAGTWSPWAPTSQLTPRAKPTVSDVTVSAPAGSLTPVVSWTATAGYGSAEAWQVRISPAAAGADAPLWDSTVRPGAAATVQAPATAGWTNGASLHAWVRAMQTGGLWSEWVSTAAPWAVTWTPPAAPSSVTATDDPSSPLTVTVAGIGAGMSGVEVQTSVDTGSTWQHVRSIEFPDPSVAILLPLVEYGVPLAVRARCWRIVDGVRLDSAWTQSAGTATSTWGGTCLISDDGSEWLQVMLERGADQDRELVQGVTVSYGLGSPHARVDRTEIMGERGTAIVLALDPADVDAVMAWLTSRDVWWLRWGAERSESGPVVSGGITRMTAAAALTKSRLGPRHTGRRITFDWVSQ